MVCVRMNKKNETGFVALSPPCVHRDRDRFDGFHAFGMMPLRFGFPKLFLVQVVKEIRLF